MKRFLKYCSLFSLPVLVVVGMYVVFDPFKVIWHYDNYYCTAGGDVNRAYVSTMNYLNKKDTYHYDSFIFGNSRSLFYRIKDWKQYIPEESKCYHFSESGGSVEGILLKMKLIDSLHESINNALIVMDCDLLHHYYKEGALFLTPPALTGNRNWFKFHTTHLTQWLNPSFLINWVKYKVTGKYEPSMGAYLTDGLNYRYYDPITNEEPRHVQDSLIAAGVYYNDKKVLKTFEGMHYPHVADALIVNDNEMKTHLQQMHALLVKHHTDYRIVIGPLYGQEKLNPQDLDYLNRLFGSERVFDFSGVNRFTMDYHNYYESSHYLPHIASEVMSIIYDEH